MKGSRAAVVVIVAVVLLGGGWWLFSRGPSATAIDLIAQFDTAIKQPNAEVFQILDGVDLNGETRKAIYAPPPTRLRWKVRVPDDAWLRVAVGMKPESWTQEGNGTYYFVIVSDGRTSDELFTQHVNPFSNPGDRKWIPVWVDLSAYAGEDVELIFNTRASPGREPDDPRNDMAMWGDPQIIVR